MKRPTIPRCQSCGVPFENHLGLQGTCAALKVALTTLADIAHLPRGGRAKRLALGCWEFLNSQMKKDKK